MLMIHSVAITIWDTFLFFAVLQLSLRAYASQWSTVLTLGAPTPREEACFVMGGNGKAYLIGGRGVLPVDEYDPLTHTWTRKTGPPLELHHMQCVPVDNRIFIVSSWTGKYPKETNVPYVFIYDTILDSWSWRVGLPTERLRGSSAAVLVGHEIYVSHGTYGGHGKFGVATGWLDKYNYLEDKWTTHLADAPNPRDHTGGVYVDGKICVAAGRQTGINFFNATVLPTDCYDIETNTWTVEADIPQGRAGSAYGLTCDGKMMVAGGEGYGVAWSRVDVFNGTSWAQFDSLTEARHGTGIAFSCSCNQIHIAAGAGSEGGSMKLFTTEAWFAGTLNAPCSSSVPSTSPTIFPNMLNLSPSSHPSTFFPAPISFQSSISPSSSAPAVELSLKPTAGGGKGTKHKTQMPTTTLSVMPSQRQSSVSPSVVSSDSPIASPSEAPSSIPSAISSWSPTFASESPSIALSELPTVQPSSVAIREPTVEPSLMPSLLSASPSVAPTETPTTFPTKLQTVSPTSKPSSTPPWSSTAPSTAFTDAPTIFPTLPPNPFPSSLPSWTPSSPSHPPSIAQTDNPSIFHSTPSSEPTKSSIRINAGGTAYNDSDGNVWMADDYFYGGSGYSRKNLNVLGTEDDLIYRSERYGNHTYKIPLPKGVYNVTLHFSEIYFMVAGERVFNVDLNGIRFLTNLDLVAEVGFRRAVTYSNLVEVSSGFLTANFITVIGDAKVSGIEVVESTLSATPAFAKTSVPSSAQLTLPSRSPTDTPTAWSVSRASPTLLPKTEKGSPSPRTPDTQSEIPTTMPSTSLDIASVPNNPSAWPQSIPTGATPLPSVRSEGTKHSQSILINSGGSGFIDTVGRKWLEDTYFTSGTNYSNPTAAIPYTKEDELYRTGRLGNITYSIPLLPGAYSVVLHFADILEPEARARRFDVYVQGKMILADLDITGSFGFRSAVNFSAVADVDDDDAFLRVDVVSASGNAIVSGIEVEPVSTPAQALNSTALQDPADPTEVIRINCGGDTFVDNFRRRWQADTFFSAGNVYSVRDFNIFGTAANPIFSQQRFGEFTYEIPVPNGSYNLTLHFAEVYFRRAGDRVFNVLIEDHDFAKNLDLFHHFGFRTAGSLRTTVLVRDSALSINLVSINRAATLAGIEVLPS